MQKKSEWKIVFMGTPHFGVPSLRALCENGYDVAAVVTQPDRPRGRGHRLVPSPVKVCAQELHLPVYQPEHICSEEGLEWMRSVAPDLVVTAAFGQILTEEFLEIPRLGCINVHASLLPKYRGASPVVWSLIDGEAETGVTTMFTVRALDAGPILEQDRLAVSEGMTGGDLMDALSHLGAGTLLRTLRSLEEDTLSPVEQCDELATYCSQLPRDFPHLDFRRTNEEIIRFVRALAPEPGAYLYLPTGERLHVYEASVSPDEREGEPGEIVAADPHNGLLVHTKDGVLSLETIKRENGKKMSARDSLRGRRIELGRVREK